MSISNFYSAAAANDFARLFQFQLINWNLGNSSLQFSGGGELIYVETASLPGRAINNIPVPFMGLSFNVPGTVAFPGSAAWNVTFRCDASYSIRAQLEDELVKLFSVATTTGRYSIPHNDNYIELALLGKGTDANSKQRAAFPPVIRSYKLIGPYLVSLADTQYDVKDTGQIATINATIAYQYWTSGSVKAANPVNQSSTTGFPLFNKSFDITTG